MKDKCENCIHFGRDTCRHETYDKCNYSPRPLHTCCLTLRGEDAKRFMEHLNEPPTEQDIEIAKWLKKMMEQPDHEEFLEAIDKRNCSNCKRECSSSGIHTCTEWEE